MVSCQSKMMPSKTKPSKTKSSCYKTKLSCYGYTRGDTPSKI